MLSEKEKREFVCCSVQKYKKPNKPLYILYKDYNDFDSTLYSIWFSMGLSCYIKLRQRNRGILRLLAICIRLC